jgi:hypothetical protein
VKEIAEGKEQKQIAPYCRYMNAGTRYRDLLKSISEDRILFSSPNFTPNQAQLV